MASVTTSKSLLAACSASSPSGVGCKVAFWGKCDALECRLGDEEINDAVGGAAHCQEPCMVGIVTGDVLEAIPGLVGVCAIGLSAAGVLCRQSFRKPAHRPKDSAFSSPSKGCAVARLHWHDPPDRQRCKERGIDRARVSNSMRERERDRQTESCEGENESE